MGRYLKKFSTIKAYQNYINDEDSLILPNVSFVEGDAYCYFIPEDGIGEPGQPTPEVDLTPTIHATFNATSENMRAFIETSNIKSLKIDGNQIDVGTPVPTQGSLNIAGNDVTINTETNEAVVSPEYLVNTSEADFVSLKFTPTDKNISFDDYNAFVLIMEMDGVVQAMPIPMEEKSMYMGMEYQSESHTIIVPQYFFTYLKMAGQINPTGITGVFAKVNLDNGIIENLLDTTCNYYTVSGGLAGLYTFETEGTHEVEIELTDNSPTDMLFASSCVSNITYMKDIKSIAPHTFTSCPYLEEIAIPNDVTEIYCMALANTPITEFTIPDSITYIGSEAFRECTSLTSVTIPNSVTEIGYGAFESCSNLASVDLGNGVTYIDQNAFKGCDSLTSITIPDSVTEIGYGAFESCSNLASVDLGNGVTYIGQNAFKYCSALTSVVIPNSVTYIDAYTFYNCTSLTSITIPDSVTSIGDAAFNNCTALTSITIPDSVTEIANSVLYACPNLTSVYCKATIPPTIGASIFNWNVEGRKIYVPMNSVDAYKSAAGWSDYANYIEGYNF